MPEPPRPSEQQQRHFDVLIVGAGISGISAAYHLQTRCPRKTLRDPRGARAHRRHLGPVPLSGHPLGLGHVHARVLVPPLDGPEGDRRRPVDPRLHARDGRDVRHRPQIRYGHRVERAQLVERARRGGRSTSREVASGETLHLHVRASCSCAPATTTTTRGYTPEFAGDGALPRPDRPPAALAAGHRLRRASASSSSAAARPP